jgi:hypothetical protein
LARSRRPTQSDRAAARTLASELGYKSRSKAWTPGKIAYVRKLSRTPVGRAALAGEVRGQRMPKPQREIARRSGFGVVKDRVIVPQPQGKRVTLTKRGRRVVDLKTGVVHQTVVDLARLDRMTPVEQRRITRPPAGQRMVLQIGDSIAYQPFGQGDLPELLAYAQRYKAKPGEMTIVFMTDNAYQTARAAQLAETDRRRRDRAARKRAEYRRVARIVRPF